MEKRVINSGKSPDVKYSFQRFPAWAVATARRIWEKEHPNTPITADNRDKWDKLCADIADCYDPT
jgi:hypothetical protein